MRASGIAVGFAFMIALVTSAAAQTKIYGERWELVEVKGKPVADPRVFIQFDETTMRFSGNGGCNRIVGDYWRSGQDLALWERGAARRACLGPGVMETESKLLAALKEVRRWQRDGPNLTLFLIKNRTLKFQARQKDRAAFPELTSKKWVLAAIGGKAVTLEAMLPYVVFDSVNMSVGGNAGCNGYGGKYKVDGSALSTSDIFSTLMACAGEGRMEAEIALLRGLRLVDRYEIKNGRLFFYKGADLLLEFDGITDGI